jgi:NADPH:quinone reductase-like Zn-dependent oxidoreductase
LALTPSSELIMKAVTIVDGDLRWTAHPDPEPSDTEILVAVRAAGLNAADLLQRRGFYPVPPGSPPDIPGLELAGEVVEVGRRASRFRVGDRVMALVGGGAQAELTTVDETSALAVPADVPWEEAGAFVEGFITAYDALFSQCGIVVGDRLLVTGAAGGVGTAAVQLAAVSGASVIASVRAVEHRDALVALGATAALGPEEALGRGPFNVALELVGGSSLPGVLRVMALGGRIAVIGVGGGASTELELLELMQRRARIGGSTLRARSGTEKALVVAEVESHVVPLFVSRRVRVPVHATFSMESAADAYACFEAGKKLGKIVLVAN